jgi:hypothetical protein
MPPEKIAELRVKHLEMVQSLITRMAGYGASFKSYCITVVTAVIGFALTAHKPSIASSKHHAGPWPPKQISQRRRSIA